MWIEECKGLANRGFICTHCGKLFCPAWQRLWFKRLSIYTNHEAKLKCPSCGIRDFCTQNRDR